MTRTPVSRSALATMLVDVVRQLSATRQAFHVAVAIIAEGDRALRESEERYGRLLDEHRRLRGDLMRKATAA